MGADPVRLIGLDPGLTHTGWGIVESTPGRLRFVASGRVSTAAGTASRGPSGRGSSS
ncbi:MAG: crossover junction endodeoxyribonuclease RuvC, partial [Alphaproteobacteria bacterium]